MLVQNKSDDVPQKDNKISTSASEESDDKTSSVASTNATSKPSVWGAKKSFVDIVKTARSPTSPTVTTAETKPSSPDISAKVRDESDSMWFRS